MLKVSGLIDRLTIVFIRKKVIYKYQEYLELIVYINYYRVRQNKRKDKINNRIKRSFICEKIIYNIMESYVTIYARIINDDIE